MSRRFGDARFVGDCAFAAACLGDARVAGDPSAFARLGDARLAVDARPGDVAPAFSCVPHGPRLGFALPAGEWCWRLGDRDRCQPLPGVYTWPMHMAYTHGLHTCLFICLYTWPIHMVTMRAELVVVVTARRLPLRGRHLRSSFADGPDR